MKLLKRVILHLITPSFLNPVLPSASTGLFRVLGSGYFVRGITMRKREYLPNKIDVVCFTRKVLDSTQYSQKNKTGVVTDVYSGFQFRFENNTGSS